MHVLLCVKMITMPIIPIVFCLNPSHSPNLKFNGYVSHSVIRMLDKHSTSTPLPIILDVEVLFIPDSWCADWNTPYVIRQLVFLHLQDNISNNSSNTNNNNEDYICWRIWYLLLIRCYYSAQWVWGIKFSNIALHHMKTAKNVNIFFKCRCGYYLFLWL